MKRLLLEPVARMAGTLRVPGSKSLSNRLLLLAALAEGTTRLEHLLDSDDVRRMLGALERLGVDVQRKGDCVTVTGVGGVLRAPSDAPVTLELGNAGTAVRPLTAVLTLGSGHFRLQGDPRMHERPIGPLVTALRSLGAQIRHLEKDGYLPLQITGSGLDGGSVSLDGSLSSQFVSALLMAAPLARAAVTLERSGELVSDPYIEITRRCMAHFGVDVAWPEPRRLEIPVATYKSPGTIAVEGDASSASYFLAAGAIAGGPVRVLGVGSDSMQGDVAFADVLEAMGAVVRRGPDWLEVERGTLRGIDMDLNHITDAAMTIATTALFAEGPTRIRNVANWRVKETDRIAAMARELRKLGASVMEYADGLLIRPPQALRPASVHTYDDHRMAMCFALTALGGAPVTIEDPDCVGKTYPGFFADFARLRSG
ncbi:MAG: 3-phosphoshikimate 1-carboxyvinyltransferase [Gammaproteobacteria bacterium]|nr:MAG: 3-phosphoshikimate 1-carboxyvinyltransferase [Gammaproteobacteria bacterium]